MVSTPPAKRIGISFEISTPGTPGTNLHPPGILSLHHILPCFGSGSHRVSSEIGSPLRLSESWGRPQVSAERSPFPVSAHRLSDAPCRADHRLVSGGDRVAGRKGVMMRRVGEMEGSLFFFSFDDRVILTRMCGMEREAFWTPAPSTSGGEVQGDRRDTTCFKDFKDG